MTEGLQEGLSTLCTKEGSEPECPPGGPEREEKEEEAPGVGREGVTGEGWLTGAESWSPEVTEVTFKSRTIRWMSSCERGWEMRTEGTGCEGP